MAELPPHLTRVGLLLSRSYDVPILGPVVSYLNESPTSAFKKIPYYRTKVVFGADEPGQLPLTIEADEIARLWADYIQRYKKHASIIRVARSALDQLIEESGGQPAVAVKIGKAVAAGVFPNGVKDLGIPKPAKPGDPEEYAVGLRTGTMPLRAGLGTFYKSQSIFFPAQGAYMANEEPLTIRGGFPTEYSDTPLV